MADFSNQTKMFFLSGIDNLRDPVRTTRWRVLIPSSVFAASGIQVTNGDQFTNGEDGTDNFALHVKSCQIPTLKNTSADHHYMGFPQAHVVNTDISADIEFETILLEDMRAYEAMLGWEQACQNTGVLVNEQFNDRMNQTGLRLGLGNHKDIENPTVAVVRNSNIKIELHNWMRGEVIMRLNLINAYPTQITGFDLSYKDANIANFKFTLHADRWTIQIPEDYATGL
jgi:hypothetical protein